MRITPIVPNWFINISSPILDVPISIFFSATFIGLMPANVIHVKTGLMLNDIQTVGGIDYKVNILFKSLCKFFIEYNNVVWNRNYCIIANIFQKKAIRKI